MSVIDCHFHWYPRSLFEHLGQRTDCPRAEPAAHTYAYWYGNGRKATLKPDWNFHNLEEGLAVAREATGTDTEVICTAGVLAGLLDQLPVAEGSKIATIYNTTLADTQRDHPGKFYGTALVPLRDTDEALRLVDEAVNQLGLRGINLPAVSNGDLIDVPRLESFYALVAELGVPLIVHPTDILYREQFPEYDGAVYLTIGRLLDSSLTILRLIFSGIMERHPRLQILHNHAGSLLPYRSAASTRTSAPTRS
jgi:aminocarboxymuconate-semialdehyde decarboxylase